MDDTFQLSSDGTGVHDFIIFTSSSGLSLWSFSGRISDCFCSYTMANCYL